MSFYYYLVFLSLNLVHDLTAFVVRIFVIVADFSLASAFGIAFFFFFFSKVWLIPFLHYGAGISGLYCFFFLFGPSTFRCGVSSRISWANSSSSSFFLPEPSFVSFYLFFFFNSIVWLSFLSTPPDTSFMSTTVSFLFLTSGIVFADNPSFFILLLLIFSA